ncbi:hypothetical protein PR202_ga30411 [Eleusine coracana subsp. coracana]|uniref:Thioredoxin-like fold domain-containing protein n=1 Tax=Eleusine coracana subsp. coracana TaxID=191504 RepID=A0AAV5DPQ4_ELECO|nr:hypothetical protein PR202_ga30411 [Eleusine coracana subsp. coracana]
MPGPPFWPSAAPKPSPTWAIFGTVIHRPLLAVHRNWTVVHSFRQIKTWRCSFPPPLVTAVWLGLGGFGATATACRHRLALACAPPVLSGQPRHSGAFLFSTSATMRGEERRGGRLLFYVLPRCIGVVAVAIVGDERGHRRRKAAAALSPPFLSCFPSLSSLALQPQEPEEEGGGAATIPLVGVRVPREGERTAVERFHYGAFCLDARAGKTAASFGSICLAALRRCYHSNAFTACRSINVANKLNPTFVYPLLERFFKYQVTARFYPKYNNETVAYANERTIEHTINWQEGYYNQPTYTKSRATVVDEITSNLVIPIIGEANLEAYRAGFNDSQSDHAARISFKNGCARGVTGTPNFFVNGIPLSDSGSPLDYNKWISILDPLVGKM